MGEIAKRDVICSNFRYGGRAETVPIGGNWM
jgi:hypothetical protein